MITPEKCPIANKAWLYNHTYKSLKHSLQFSVKFKTIQKEIKFVTPGNTTKLPSKFHRSSSKCPCEVIRPSIGFIRI
ncbi:hypothetical protein HanIR_Chr07g0333001 [Helianthus annuus]|nr:hypothetical protein HanIR_Chr07g0333001 [Helianthus annuus]